MVSGSIQYDTLRNVVSERSNLALGPNLTAELFVAAGANRAASLRMETLPAGSGDAPVLVVQTAKMWEGNDLALFGCVDGPSVGALLVQREMGSCRLVVGEFPSASSVCLRAVFGIASTSKAGNPAGANAPAYPA